MDPEPEHPSDDEELQSGDMVTVAFPDWPEMQFVVSDVQQDGDDQVVSLIPDPDNPDVAP